MSDRNLVKISTLPNALTYQQAVEMAYIDDIEWIEEKISKGMNTLIECDKQLINYIYKALSIRLKRRGNSNRRMVMVSGPDPESGGNIIRHLLNSTLKHVFSGESDLCLVIPHLDVAVTTTSSSFTDTARELLAAVYENPDVRLIAFKDPSLDIPDAIARLFSANRRIMGVSREVLPSIITQREARKFGFETFNPFRLYKYVSGMNVVRLREVLESFQDRIDFNPENEGADNHLYRELRMLTISSDVELPNVSLERDIGGYEGVKKKMREDILDLLSYKETLTDIDEVKAIEEIIPKGMMFVGPPGTGKTYFAKAMATALDATVIVVSGPELKSKWVGDSEKNLREVFLKARQSAPSIIIFDEIDSFATHRGTYTGSGVEHSMVNQLLTEMDGFRKDELIFVVATTNFAESIDAALLRPGRFELQIEIPYPDESDRKTILDIYRKKFKLNLSDELLNFLVSHTEGLSDKKLGTKYSGDHLYAVCRGLKREAIRKFQKSLKSGEKISPTGIALTEADCLDNLPKNASGKANVKDRERRVIAVHEVGHAIISLSSKYSKPIKKITVDSEHEYALGYVEHSKGSKEYILSRNSLLDNICVSFGGREAERLRFDDFSAGCAHDLQTATRIAKMMVEDFSMSNATQRSVNTRESGVVYDESKRPAMSAYLSEQIDKEIDKILNDQAVRAANILSASMEPIKAKKTVDRTSLFDRVLEAVLEKKSIDATEIDEIVKKYHEEGGTFEVPTKISDSDN